MRYLLTSSVTLFCAPDAADAIVLDQSANAARPPVKFPVLYNWCALFQRRSGVRSR